jgi:hypothetical protein
MTRTHIERTVAVPVADPADVEDDVLVGAGSPAGSRRQRHV